MTSGKGTFAVAQDPRPLNAPRDAAQAGEVVALDGGFSISGPATTLHQRAAAGAAFNPKKGGFKPSEDGLKRPPKGRAQESFMYAT